MNRTEVGKRKTFRALALCALWLFFVIGFLLNLQLSQRFFFFFEDQYNSIAWWTFLLLLPFSAMSVYRWSSSSYIHGRYPTRWFRRLMYPLLVVSFAGMAVFAPRGWITLSVMASGIERYQIPAKVIEIDVYRQSAKGCDQFASFSYRSTIAKICLEDRFNGTSLTAGQAVLLSGRESSAGFIINLIEQ